MGLPQKSLQHRFITKYGLKNKKTSTSKTSRSYQPPIRGGAFNGELHRHDCIEIIIIQKNI
jgi:hypothetical protein